MDDRIQTFNTNQKKKKIHRDPKRSLACEQASHASERAWEACSQAKRSLPLGFFQGLKKAQVVKTWKGGSIIIEKQAASIHNFLLPRTATYILLLDTVMEDFGCVACDQNFNAAVPFYLQTTAFVIVFIESEGAFNFA